METNGNERQRADFNIFIGAETGVLKCVSINPKANLLKNFGNNSSTSLDRDLEITCLEWGNDAESEILIGLRNQFVKVFNVAEKNFDSAVNLSAGHGPLRGIAKFNDAIVTATESGLIRLWRSNKEEQVTFEAIDAEVETSGKLRAGNFENEESRAKHLAMVKAGRQLCKMRQFSSAKNLIATGGKENRLQIWDLSRPDASPIFSAKNVKPDSLQLRVPVWVTDISFPDAQASSTVATVSRHGHVRLYDIRSNQRRPVQDLVWEDEALTATAATLNKDQILVGSGKGNLALYDFRAEHKGLFRKYKGCVGSVRSIYSSPEHPYFAVVGLDRFLRIFNISSQKSVQKMYLKTRMNAVLVSKDFDPSQDMTEDKVEKIVKKSKDIRPAAEAVGDGEDEQFWAKIPVIRERKKRGVDKDKMSTKKSRKF